MPIGKLFARISELLINYYNKYAFSKKKVLVLVKKSCFQKETLVQLFG